MMIMHETYVIIPYVVPEEILKTLDINSYILIMWEWPVEDNKSPFRSSYWNMWICQIKDDSGYKPLAIL